MKPTFLLFAPVLLFTSCATITRGVHEKLKVESDPSGASVVLSTGEKGITPTTFVEKRRRDSFTVTVTKPGYVAQTLRVESKAGGTGATAMAGNVVLGGVIGMGVDAGTGAYNSLYPNPVSVRLVPLRAPSATTTMTTTSKKKKLESPTVTPLTSPPRKLNIRAAPSPSPTP